MGLVLSTLLATVPPAFKWSQQDLYQNMSRALTNAIRTSINFLVSLRHSCIMVVTLGIPYLQYQSFRYNEVGNEGNPIQMWFEVTEEMNALWEAYYTLSAVIFPFVFPMISFSGLPLCSTTGFMATVTLLFGSVNIATSYGFKQSIKTLQNARLANYWVEASQQTWNEVSNKGFWILLSLPTVWFSLSAGLFISTVMISVWERSVAGVVVNAEKAACSTELLRVFKYISMITLIVALIHFLFLFAKMRSMIRSARP